MRGYNINAVAFLLLIFHLWIDVTDAKNKTFPDFVSSKWFSLEDVELETIITKTTLSNKHTKESILIDYSPYEETRDANGHFDGRYLIHNPVTGCYLCYEIFFKTVNILQYRKSACISKWYDDEVFTLDSVCSNIAPSADVVTWFRTEVKPVNCKTTWEGTYSFTYEVDQGGGSICESPQSAVVACQEPGSVYVDNEIFTMNFGKCHGVGGSANQKIRFQCLGSWKEGKNVFSAIADIGEVKLRQRYRCMLTRPDQQYADNTRYYTLSRFGECSTLRSPYDGPIRLKLWPAYIGHMGEDVYGVETVHPHCNFPRNFTGTWFTTNEFDSHVVINLTHIYFKTKLDQYTYRESVFVCQQSRDSRFLVTAVTIGKCEVDYVCFDFMARHHNIIRWRMGRPYRSTTHSPDAFEKIFRHTCTWSSFTLNREDTNWRYNTFILSPPAPVPCPIGGRYNFTQIGAREEKYITRIQGITQRPRHSIDCKKYVTEFKSCDSHPKSIYVDAEYCESMDHTGRPISEYDQPDRQLFCVGYWMEDMKSYMITYDMEDAVSPYRCWVYERMDWRLLYASRSIRAACAPQQTAYSSTAKEGASLGLVLRESERLWDSCPQRYDTGAHPYSKELKVHIIHEELSSASNSFSLSISLLMFSAALTFFI